MRHQSGFTLIEVMVAFMVMAIGMLGVMGLQNTAIRNNSNTTAQMQAVLLSREMADLVRANPEAMELNRAYNKVTAANNSSCGTAAGCTPLQMAAYDKWLWDARVVESIGTGATGIVCVDAVPNDGTSVASNGCDGIGDAWVVKLWWTDGADTIDLHGQERTTADLAFTKQMTNRPSYYMSFFP